MASLAVAMVVAMEDSPELLHTFFKLKLDMMLI
jgi:hypothetical protein